MRLALLLILLLLAACTSPTDDSMRGQPCSYDLDCGEALLCAEFVCEVACQLEGDCDPGYACEGSICVPTCESQADCERGTCSPRDNAEEGMACHVGYLPSCAMGCGPDEICEFGQCAPRCFDDSECPPGLSCRPSYADSGSVCLVGELSDSPRTPGPDPPDVDACTEAFSWRDYCSVQFADEEVDGGLFCGLDGECHEQGERDFVFVVRDETPEAGCDDSINGLAAPGTDIWTIRLSGPLSSSALGVPRVVDLHQDGSTNDFQQYYVVDSLDNNFSCEEIDSLDFLSLTCGGSLVFEFVGHNRQLIWPDSYMDIFVGEFDRCGMTQLDRFSLGICGRTAAVLSGDYEADCVFEEYDSSVSTSHLFDLWDERRSRP